MRAWLVPLLVCAALRANAATPLGDPTQNTAYSAAQMSAGGNVYDLGASTVSRCLRASSASSVCEWIRPGTLVVLESLAQNITCVASMTSTLTLGAWGGSTQCTATIGSTAYRNTSCVPLLEGHRRDQALEAQVMIARAGSRTTGICVSGGQTAWIQTITGELAALGCTANGDCTDQGLSGATCDTTLSAEQQTLLTTRGAITYVCRAAASSAFLAVSAEQ